MKILIVPMAAAAETSGPVGRCALIARGLADAGIEVATCMAEDVNFRRLDGIKHYFLDVPTPLGLPGPIAKNAFPIAQKLGITARKRVGSFDEVLRLTGNLNYGYLARSVASIRRAIADFGPDAVYSEFSLSAMIAARAEGVKLFTTVSYPTRYEYAHTSGIAGGLNRLLRELGLPEVDSALKLFTWADKRFCPSIPELEPFPEGEAIFCGTLKGKPSSAAELSGAGEYETDARRAILVYMGNGTISAGKMRNEITKAFLGSDCDVYIASQYLAAEENANIHIAPRWDFGALLPKAGLFINHGGQNSIADGLIYGVPQIMVPGKVFERIYNAESVERNGAGKVLPHGDFLSDRIRALADELLSKKDVAANAAELGRKLTSAGGTDTVIENL